MNGGASLPTVVKTVKDRIGLLMTDQQLADVHFTVGQRTRFISAHRLILTTCSPVFKAMFYGPAADKSCEVIVTDISPNGFSQMIRYIYTDFCSLTDENDAFETFKAAQKYMISGLEQKCVFYLSRVKLQPDTVSTLLQNSLCFNMDNLKHRCLKYIENKTEEVMKSQSFLHLAPEAVKLILMLGKLNVDSENKLFEFVISWAVKQQEISEGSNSLSEIVNPMLPYICFESICPQEFCSTVQKYPDIFSTEEALSLLMNYVKPGSRPTPEWYRRRNFRHIAPNVRVKVCFSPQVLNMKVRSDSWYTSTGTFFICGVWIKDILQPINIWGISIEWRILAEDLQTVVSIDHLATANYEQQFNQRFEATGEVVGGMTSEFNNLQVSFQNPIRVTASFPDFPVWIIMRLRFSKKLTIKYKQHSDVKTDCFHCEVLLHRKYVPIISQLLYSREQHM